MTQCQRPPEGWECTRGEHPDGTPCAAIPSLAAIRAWQARKHDPTDLSERLPLQWEYIIHLVITTVIVVGVLGLTYYAGAHS